MTIYFAGPPFTPYERGFIDECAAQLRADGLEAFVPHPPAPAQSDANPACILGHHIDCPI